MKKRFLCALLTLIMLVSLVPTAALNVSAAGKSVSESAITVLKQWNGYHSTCKANGYIGYGTPCTVKGTHGSHTVTEKKADEALRAALAKLDTAVNNFASNNGLSLTQGQHDALVLFSFDNGTAWTTGTGSFRSAVVNKLRGSDFLNAICNWNNSVNDDSRRMVEANMYLNGVYSSAAPSSFIRVYYDPGYVMEPAFDPITGDPILDANGDPMGEMPVPGSMGSINPVQYYDLSTHPSPNVVPTLGNYTFIGWFAKQPDHDSMQDISSRVTSLTTAHHNKTLYAGWLAPGLTYEKGELEEASKYDELGAKVYYIIPASQILSSDVYPFPDGKAIEKLKVSDFYYDGKSVRVDRDFVNGDGTRWCRLVTEDLGASKKIYWIKVAMTGATTGSSQAPSVDVTVTVTNTYVRARAEDSIFSAQIGTYNQGAQLRITNTSHNDGFLWGQVAKSATDNTPVSWVALMYTNWDSVRNQNNVNYGTPIATATVTEAAYVNLRSGAGTENQIVGALTRGTLVDLYEIKYVNGHRWGRCNTGWFSLTYAEVTMLTDDTSYTTDANYLAYVFTGTIRKGTVVYKEPGGHTAVTTTYDMKSDRVTVTHLAYVDGHTWGKIAEGWVKLSAPDGTALDIKLDETKYVVSSDTLTVRKGTSVTEERVDTLVKGVEFVVNRTHQIVMTEDSVWGYANKVGESNQTYEGWINLSGATVSRVNPPAVESGNTTSNQRATVINTDSVNVRASSAATYAKIGTLARGTTVAVWDEEDGWYKVDSNCNGKYDYEEDGWVSGMYLNVFEAEDDVAGTGTSGNAGGVVETGMGIVANTYTGVNVRNGAGTGYGLVGKILAGTSVEILEVKTVGASKWGRVTQGWICMDYVTMISNYPIAGATTGTTGSSSSTNTTASETVIFTGKIKADTKVCSEPSVLLFNNVSNGDGSYTEKVRSVYTGTPVTVHELLVVEETVEEEDGDTIKSVTTKYYWARTNDGYIKDPEINIELDALNEKTYTVTSYENSVDNELDVWEESCESVKAVPTLNMYDQVTVTTLKIHKNNLWCRVEYTDDEGVNHDGYVQMKYLTNGAVSAPSSNNTTTTPTTPNAGAGAGNLNMGSTGNTANQGSNGFVNNAGGYRYTGKVIRTGSVNVRALPSQTATLTTTLKQGAALVIYETTINESMAWGRCDAGWVYLYYVDLQPCNNAVDAKVVYNENTIIYTDANCSGVAGTYSRMSVVDIYEQVGSMCRTEQGWVHVDNLG